MMFPVFCPGHARDESGHFNFGKNFRAVAQVAALNSSSEQPLTSATTSEISFT